MVSLINRSGHAPIFTQPRCPYLVIYIGKPTTSETYFMEIWKTMIDDGTCEHIDGEMDCSRRSCDAEQNVDDLGEDLHTSITGERSSRVLLIDDQPMVRYGIILFLEDEDGLTVCGEVSDTESAIAAIQRTQPDVIILDLFLGKAKSDGLQLTKTIRFNYPELPILVLSLHSESIFAKSCIHVGANGYLMKSDASEYLIQAIHTVLRGETYVSDVLRETSAGWQK